MLSLLGRIAVVLFLDSWKKRKSRKKVKHNFLSNDRFNRVVQETANQLELDRPLLFLNRTKIVDGIKK